MKFFSKEFKNPEHRKQCDEYENLLAGLILLSGLEIKLQRIDHDEYRCSHRYPDTTEVWIECSEDQANVIKLLM